MEEADVKLHIIGILPQLKYLDFILVTSDQIQEAFSKFPFEKGASSCAEQTRKENFTCSYAHSDKEAYVEGLANGQGFQSLLLSCKNFQLLCSFPLAAEIYQEFSLKCTKIFDDWHKSGHKFYEEIQHEKSQCLLMVSKSKEFSMGVFQEEELKFIDFKEKIPKDLCRIYHNTDLNDKKAEKIAELKKICEKHLQKTFRNFMNCNCLYIDLITNLCKIYEKQVNAINGNYAQEVSKFSSDIMDLYEKLSEKLEEFYINILKSGVDLSEYLRSNDIEEIADDLLFLQLCKDKESIETTLESSLRINFTMLSERVNRLKINLHRSLAETVDQISEQAFVSQSEFVKNTIIFCNKQKYFIDNLFSKNNVFERYFGFHQNVH